MPQDSNRGSRYGSLAGFLRAVGEFLRNADGTLLGF